MPTALIDKPGIRTTAGAVAAILAFGAWELAGRTDAVAFLVPFSDAVGGVWGLVSSSSLTTDILPSALRALCGFLLGSVIGIVAGVPLGYIRGLNAWFRPTLEFLRATPIPAVLPVAFVAFGPTDLTRVGLIALGAVWPVLLNSTDGARAVDRNLIDAARAARLGRLRLIITVVLRASLPQIFAGLRIALGLALVMMVVSEMVSSTDGLGFLVLQSQRSFALTQMYAGVLLLGALGGAFTIIFTVCERRILRWYAGQKGLQGA